MKKKVFQPATPLSEIGKVLGPSVDQPAIVDVDLDDRDRIVIRLTLDPRTDVERMRGAEVVESLGRIVGEHQVRAFARLYGIDESSLTQFLDKAR